MARILLVEDDPDVRPVMEYLLDSEGHQVTSVARYAEAIALLETPLFDLVVTDAKLPDGSGLSVADRAKSIGIRALVVTGYSPYGKTGSLGRYDCLFKPIRTAELLKAIRHRLARDNAEIVAFPKS